MTKKTILSFFTLAMLLYVNVYGGDSKIIFSKTHVKSDVGETTFNVGDNIYGKIILKKPLNKYKGSMNYDIRVRVGEQGFYLVDHKFNTSEEANITEINFTFLNSEEKPTDELKKILEAINNLNDGTHTVTVKVFTKKMEDPIVIGEFALVKVKGGKNLTLGGKKLSDFKSSMNDPKLEADAIDVINKYYKKYFGTSKSIKQKAVIVNKDWNIMRNNATGVIIGRMVDVLVQETDDKGVCKIIQYVVSQEYNGSGYQNALFLEMMNNGNSPVIAASQLADCE